MPKAQTVFKPLLIPRLLHMCWLKKVTGPKAKTLPNHGYKKRNDLWRGSKTSEKGNDCDVPRQMGPSADLQIFLGPQQGTEISWRFLCTRKWHKVNRKSWLMQALWMGTKDDLTMPD